MPWILYPPSESLFSLIASFIQAVTFLETLNAAGGINQLLFAGEKRMAGGTEFQPDIGLGGTGFKLVAAGAADRNGVVLGMDSFFHHQPQKNHIAGTIRKSAQDKRYSITVSCA
jgi:hypothetical protein